MPCYWYASFFYASLFILAVIWSVIEFAFIWSKFICASGLKGSNLWIDQFVFGFAASCAQTLFTSIFKMPFKIKWQDANVLGHFVVGWDLEHCPPNSIFIGVSFFSQSGISIWKMHWIFYTLMFKNSAICLDEICTVLHNKCWIILPRNVKLRNLSKMRKYKICTVLHNMRLDL